MAVSLAPDVLIEWTAVAVSLASLHSNIRGSCGGVHVIVLTLHHARRSLANIQQRADCCSNNFNSELAAALNPTVSWLQYQCQLNCARYRVYLKDAEVLSVQNRSVYIVLYCTSCGVIILPMKRAFSWLHNSDKRVSTVLRILALTYDIDRIWVIRIWVSSALICTEWNYPCYLFRLPSIWWSLPIATAWVNTWLMYLTCS